MQEKVESTLKKFPEVAFVFSKTGTAEMASDPMPPNVSDTFVMLHPSDTWPNPHETKLELIQKIETALRELPGNNYEFTQPIEMRFNELIAGVRSDVAVKIYGDNFDVMQKTGESIAKVIRTIPGAADVKVAQTDGLPVLEVNIKKEAAKQFGLSTAEILHVVSTAIGGQPAGLVLEGDQRYNIVVRLPEELRENPTVLGNLPIPLPYNNGNRAFIPLKEVAALESTEGVNEITRENGKRMVVVESNVRGRDLGSFVDAAKELINAKVKIPPGYWIDWGGEFQNLLAAKQHLALIIPICFGLILLLLFSGLHSIRLALLVFTGVPLALSGGILALWIRDIPFSISAAVGFIALSGIAVLNGLVLLTSIQSMLKTSNSLDEAIEEGALIRLRPVLMTALVASLGFIPMAFATGTGA
jgi:cobalt-zinc-cadmium resistance protein CzcA